MKLFKRSRSAKQTEPHEQQQQEPTQSKSAPLHEKNREEEYVYIPSRYGYDYAPPSLQLPSSSMDSSTIQGVEEPVSALSRNTASVSSYYKKHASDYYKKQASEALRQHQEYEAKYHKKSKEGRPGGSKSHWRPSEKERQRLSEHQNKRRDEKFQEFSTLEAPPQSYREQRGPVPDPHRSTGEDIRDTVEQIPVLRNMPSLDSGLQYTKEQSRKSRYSTENSVTSSQRRNNQRTRLEPVQEEPMQRHPTGNSVAGSQRSNHQRTRQQPMQPIQPIPPIQPKKQIQEPIPYRLASHSIDDSTITTQPGAFGYPPQRAYHRQYQANRSSRPSGRPPMHGSDRNILSYHPSYHNNNDAESRASARERKRSIERSYKDYMMRERGWVPTELVRADLMNEAKKHKLFAAVNPQPNRMQEQRWVATAFTQADPNASKKNKVFASEEQQPDMMPEQRWVATAFTQANPNVSKKNKILAAEERQPDMMQEQRWVATPFTQEEASRRQEAPSSVYMVPTGVSKSNRAPKMVTKKEEKPVPPIAPIVPPPKKKKGLFKRLFGRGESNKKSTGSTGSRRFPTLRIQVDPPSRGSIRGKNPAISGTSASTRALSYSTGGSKTKMHRQSVTKNHDETPMSMTVARSIASSHKFVNRARNFREVGIQYNASARTKDSSSKKSLQKQQQQQLQIQQQLELDLQLELQKEQQLKKQILKVLQEQRQMQKQKQKHHQKQEQQLLQQQAAGSSQQSKPRAPNKIFFPDSTRNSAAGSASSRHPDDVTTKFYSAGRSKSQPRQPSHANNTTAGSHVSAGRSSSFERRQPQSSSFGSSRPSYASSSAYHQYSRGPHDSRISEQLSRSASHQGVKKNISGDSDKWVKPRARKADFNHWNHRGNGNRPPQAKQRPAPVTSNIFSLSCV